MAAVVAAVFQRYVPPPVAVKVAFAPAQMTFVPVIAVVGSGFTVTVRVAVAVQPAALVTVTV